LLRLSSYPVPLLQRQLLFFFFNDPATTEIYTLSLHDALPIYGHVSARAHTVDGGVLEHIAVALEGPLDRRADVPLVVAVGCGGEDRKSTRLNSSHDQISYAVFCLKKKTTSKQEPMHSLQRP